MLVVGGIPYEQDTQRDKIVKGLKAEYLGAVKVTIDRENRIVNYHSFYREGSDNVLQTVL